LLVEQTCRRPCSNVVVAGSCFSMLMPSQCMVCSGSLDYCYPE
jgi:hypothetical protein